MKLNAEQRRALGGLALVVGVGLAIGAVVYGQLRFPMTNYTSTITVDYPVAYYEHELRAGDTLFFHIEVTGEPVSMEVKRGSARDAGDVVLTATVARWANVPFTVPATGTYSVIFRTTCEACGSTLIRAQVDQALGSIGILPLPATVALATALAAAGGWVVWAAPENHTRLNMRGRNLGATPGAGPETSSDDRTQSRSSPRRSH